MLNTELFKSKVPLIVIVAHESCIVNRQIGVGDSKFVVYFDPSPSPVTSPENRTFALLQRDT